ncbi:ribosome silencing factor [Pediococcus claussenii]|uniref:Ribosomal silencing factor RsfS n=1 Tax=Pediococcus claussenii (strain ATCC BAA-344 / DSM 14800 / JCM 18046 / KCTC 3811 / LMG 21948 / P06) TaxID=701521 RepID=G8PDQ2_PEDCP|nr:ribosome silencing factor [Pediococcus claussenii]AEV95387.1 iojap-like ribosome-associated protein [Pediococcus claussenii ATCC BAA-344]ANZ68918.1 ribosome silencing factor RsfS [Pediococcus claussenii]ANZ70734.1 ribosome silencing factor RsfS [Pediococcus claussenii]
MNIKQTLEMVVKAADNKRAENIIALEMNEVSTLAEYFVIANADSERQVSAIADEITEQAKNNSVKIYRVEGQKASQWILIDLGEVVVNVFQTEQRKYYNLEKLWSEAKKINVQDWVTK